jgi:hypothetical protein
MKKILLNGSMAQWHSGTKAQRQFFALRLTSFLPPAPSLILKEGEFEIIIIFICI